MPLFNKTNTQFSENTSSRSESSEIEEPTICAWPECLELAHHPAPKNRINLRDYIWFCHAHIRAYNRDWNYCQDMNEAQIRDLVRDQATWERPTWQFGPHSPFFRTPHQENNNSRDNIKSGQKTQARSSENPHQDQHETTIDHESDFFDFNQLASEEDVKNRYKQLVKQLHPDINGGDKRFEERLKQINEAYSKFKRRRRFSEPRS